MWKVSPEPATASGRRMRDFNELKLSRFRRAVPPSCPRADVVRFEEKFGVKLPPAYAALLYFSNGGYPATNTFRLPGCSEALAINEFYYLAPEYRSDPSGRGPGSNLWFQMEVSSLPAQCVPIASDAFGNQVYLDLSKDPAPVMALIHDPDETVRVADSFEKFLDLLCPGD